MPRVAATPLRALFVATRLLGHAISRAAANTAFHAQTIAELRLTCAQLAHQNALLRARLGRVPARHRPHYAPDERWRLLELRALHGWSLDDTAAHALVTPATIARWQRDAQGATRDTAPTPARPRPPVRRFADVVRQLIQTMDGAGVGGNALIARTLARAGWRVSPETVRRIRRERPVRLPPAPDGTGIITRHPNHVWLLRFLAYYNHQRTHQGYRLQGRTPAAALQEALGLAALPEIGGAEPVDEAPLTPAA